MTDIEKVPPVCECRHTQRQHWAWMDDGNGWAGSPCKACDCPDFEERSMTCAYCGDRKYLRDFPYEAVCRDCLPPSPPPSTPQRRT